MKNLSFIDQDKALVNTSSYTDLMKTAEWYENKIEANRNQNLDLKSACPTFIKSK